MPFNAVRFLNGSENPLQPADARLELSDVGGGRTPGPPVTAQAGEVAVEACTIPQTVAVTDASQISIAGNILHFQKAGLTAPANEEFIEAIVALEGPTTAIPHLHGFLWAVTDQGNVQTGVFQ